VSLIFNPQVVVTSRLRLRPLREDDLALLLPLQCDPVVMQFILGGQRTPEETRADLDAYLASWRDEGYGMWAVFDRSDDTFLGIVGLVWRDDIGQVTLRVALGRESQGRGLGGEAIQAAIDWGFERLNLQSLLGIVQSANSACRKMVARLGMVLEKTWMRGTMPIEQYAVSREVWLAGRAQHLRPAAAQPALAAASMEPERLAA
jgi:RimJ/RimL family protein N-acetyltransferase